MLTQENDIDSQRAANAISNDSENKTTAENKTTYSIRCIIFYKKQSNGLIYSGQSTCRLKAYQYWSNKSPTLETTDTKNN